MIHALEQSAVFDSIKSVERPVKLDNKVVLEALWHTAAIACGVADDAVLLGLISDFRSLVKGIDYDIGLIGLGEREAQDGGTLGGRHLGSDIIVG